MHRSVSIYLAAPALWRERGLGHVCWSRSAVRLLIGWAQVLFRAALPALDKSQVLLLEHCEDGAMYGVHPLSKSTVK